MRSLQNAMMSTESTLVPGPAHHDSVHLFAPSHVRDADDRALRHGRMLRHNVLDLGRVDILSPGNDHVFDPVHDVDESILVHAAGIAVPAKFARTNNALSRAARRLGQLYDEALAPIGLKATQAG